jgi:hypothetical protein
MVSRVSKGWRWYDWIFVLIGIIVLCRAIQILAPTSGLAHALHQGFHTLAIGLEWIAGGLTALASLLNQLLFVTNVAFLLVLPHQRRSWCHQ